MKRFWQNHAQNITLVLSLGLLAYLVSLEREYFDGYTFVFTLLMVIATFFFVLFLSKRGLFSALMTFFFILCVEWVSHIKFEITNFGFHAEDIYFYLFKLDNLKFLYDHFLVYLLQIGAIFIALFLVGRLLYQSDKTRVSRLKAGAALVVLLAPIWLFPNFFARVSTNTLLYSGFYNRHIATFYVSLLEAHKQNLAANARFARLNFAPKPHVPFRVTPQNPPHIIFIHQESVFPPAVFPTLNYDKNLDGFFKSFDGKTHHLRVEIFAGTSWITEFAIQSGLSALDYGTKRQFVFALTAGKLNEALPQSLKNYGYATHHYFPMYRSFAEYEKFYTSIGMDKFLDLEDMGIKDSLVRDSQYYAQGLKGMAAHFKASNTPLYSYIQTMSPHSPYDFTFEATANTPPQDASTPKEMGEYLRRLHLSHADYQAFKADLTRLFPDKRFLIVHYGDHHPVVSRSYVVAENKNLEGQKDIYTQTNSKGMLTYYAVEGINYTPPPLPDHGIIDAAYLGTIILESAGLPLSPLKTQHRALLETCEGRLFSCKNTKAVDDFYKAYLETGAITP